MENLNTFDRRNSFEANIKPRIEEVQRLCVQLKIPFFAVFAVQNDEKGTMFKRYITGKSSTGIQLTNDEIRKHLLVSTGFDAAPPQRDTGSGMGGGRDGMDSGGEEYEPLFDEEL